MINSNDIQLPYKLPYMKISFDKYVQPLMYSVETLINGNISHCIEYLKGLKSYNDAGLLTLHKELLLIKIHAPERYEYIINKVFTD